MRIISLVMAAAFIGFASVQFNDVDAWTWVAAYTTCAFASLWAALRPIPRWLTLMLAVVFTLWALWIAPDMTGSWLNGEVEREVGGLVICASWNLVLYRWTASRS